MDWTKVGDNALFAGGILLAILKLLWIPLRWIFSVLAKVLLIIITPFRWLTTVFYHCIAAPVRFLARFETLFYYLSAACIVGLLAGTGLYYTTRILFRLLNIYDQPSQGLEASRSRTAALYRAERLQKQADEASNYSESRIPLNFPDPDSKTDATRWSLGTGIARYPVSPSVKKKGLLSTTIFEEEDSSDYTTI